MSNTHHLLLMTDKEWQTLMADFQQSLEQFRVPQHEQDKLKTTVESTRQLLWLQQRSESHHSIRGAMPYSIRLQIASC